MAPLMGAIDVCVMFEICLTPKNFAEIQTKTVQKLRETREKKLKERLPPIEERLNKLVEEKLAEDKLAEEAARKKK